MFKKTLILMILMTLILPITQLFSHDMSAADTSGMLSVRRNNETRSPQTQAFSVFCRVYPLNLTIKERWLK